MAYQIDANECIACGACEPECAEGDACRVEYVLHEYVECGCKSAGTLIPRDDAPTQTVAGRWFRRGGRSRQQAAALCCEQVRCERTVLPRIRKAGAMQRPARLGVLATARPGAHTIVRRRELATAIGRCSSTSERAALRCDAT